MTSSPYITITWTIFKPFWIHIIMDDGAYNHLLKPYPISKQAVGWCREKTSDESASKQLGKCGTNTE